LGALAVLRSRQLPAGEKGSEIAEFMKPAICAREGDVSVLRKPDAWIR
jgi:hypothetical protein